MVPETLDRNGDAAGPVVGRFGGPLLLFALPERSDDYSPMGSVVYVPAGTAVEERDRYSWNEDDRRPPRSGG
ncbi:hypothetical protein ACWC5C_23790 [Streptomyces sp. NPDC001700]